MENKALKSNLKIPSISLTITAVLILILMQYKLKYHDSYIGILIIVNAVMILFNNHHNIHSPWITLALDSIASLGHILSSLNMLKLIPFTKFSRAGRIIFQALTILALVGAFHELFFKSDPQNSFYILLEWVHLGALSDLAFHGVWKALWQFIKRKSDNTDQT